MKTYAALILASAALAQASASPDPLPAAQAAAEIIKAGAAPAVGVALIRGGRLAEECVLGVRAKGGASRARLNDRWHIGSDAKAMTATMIARLVEKGTLSWDKPL